MGGKFSHLKVSMILSDLRRGSASGKRLKCALFLSAPLFFVFIVSSLRRNFGLVTNAQLSSESIALSRINRIGELNSLQPKPSILSNLDPNKSGKGNPFSPEPNHSFSNSVIYKNQVLTPHQEDRRLSGPPEATIAYVITVPKCDDEPVWDGAAVLARTIQLNSRDNPYSSSRYGYKLYAFVHETAVGCATNYANIGYEIFVRDSPVRLDEIAPGHYANNVNSRCPLADFLSLYAFTLLDHEIVVLMDVKSMVIQPLDELYDAMLYPKDSEKGIMARKSVKSHWMGYGKEQDSEADKVYKSFPDTIQAFFTRDYTVVHPFMKEKAGVHTGFVVLRPSQEAFDQATEIIRQGAWEKDLWGWYNSGFGGYPNAMCTKGLLSFFFTRIHPHSAVELNRCFYNVVSDSPTTVDPQNDEMQLCRDGRKCCDDCRHTSLGDLKTINTSICRRPWTCHYHSDQFEIFKLCREITHEWFKLRHQVETEWARDNVGYSVTKETGSFGTLYFMGYCDDWGKNGYIPMPIP